MTIGMFIICFIAVLLFVNCGTFMKATIAVIAACYVWPGIIFYLLLLAFAVGLPYVIYDQWKNPEPIDPNYESSLSRYISSDYDH